MGKAADVCLFRLWCLVKDSEEFWIVVELLGTYASVGLLVLIFCEGLGLVNVVAVRN